MKHVGGGFSLFSAQPEVDDFDGLFAVIVRGRERERVFPRSAPQSSSMIAVGSAPHEEVGTFSGNITLPSSLSAFLP